MIMLKKAESFSLQAVRKKFSHEKYFEASKVPAKF
jgi:hypothetical protein